MSKGLVLLRSLGIGRESGGVSSGLYWTLFSSLRPQDVFSKGLVNLPRKGRLHFPWTESRISGFFLLNYMVCLYQCFPNFGSRTNMSHNPFLIGSQAAWKESYRRTQSNICSWNETQGTKIVRVCSIIQLGSRNVTATSLKLPSHEKKVALRAERRSAALYIMSAWYANS